MQLAHAHLAAHIMPLASGVRAAQTHGAALQAADSGWAKGESNLLGFNSLDFSSIPGEVRRVQAWLHDSLNRGSLAHRLQTLILLKPLLEDWYFPWALLRQDAQLAELLTELVKVWRCLLYGFAVRVLLCSSLQGPQGALLAKGDCFPLLKGKNCAV